jgi:alpha-galactosidase
VTSGSAFAAVGEVPVEPGRAAVFEHGWQSWSPSGSYPATAGAPRPISTNTAVMAYRWDSLAPADEFQGEGLVAVDPGDGGPIRLWSAPQPTAAVPSIRVRVLPDRLVVSANGPVVQTVDAGPGGLQGALARWAQATAHAAGIGPVQSYPPGWCTWYGYWSKVTEAGVSGDLELIRRHELDARLILLDEGYQAEIGDWLQTRADFGSVPRLARRILDDGRQAGIWVAPLLVGARSRTAREHPEWLVGGAHAGHNWGQEHGVLDVTHPGAAEHLEDVFRTFATYGYTHFKLDFIYAGALPGRRHAQADPIAAYREALRLIRAAVGPDAVLQGCGAPMLPSLGLVDVMRTSPDTDPAVLPASGDVSQPGQLGARDTGAAREFLHGRWWANDPDCLIVRPEVEERERWAAHVAASGGLRLSSDPIAALDDWGLDTTRRLLRPSSPEPTVPA